jgi:hypothetical protein
VSAYQTIGTVTGLIPAGGNAFLFPEFAQVVGLLSDGTTGSNAVLQSGAPTWRKAQASWQVVPTADMERLSDYAEQKSEQTLTEEDGTTRTVVLMDFAAALQFSGYWTVSATLLETTDPELPGS